MGEREQEEWSLFRQRCHEYWKLGDVGLHEPLDTASVWPTCGVPEVAGSAVFVYFVGPGDCGGAGTTPLGAEGAVVLPDLFLAVTETRRVSPASALATR